MRPVRAVARTFVYATEDEDRVVHALLFVLGRAEDMGARSRLTRSRIKSHYGTNLVFYEGVVKSPRDLRGFFGRLRSAGSVETKLREEFHARLDEDAVLHFRLDKQEAVQDRLGLAHGGDAITVEVKYERRGEGVQGFPFD